MFGRDTSIPHTPDTQGYTDWYGIWRVEPLTLTPLYLPVTLPTRQWVSRGRVGCVPR